MPGKNPDRRFPVVWFLYELNVILLMSKFSDWSIHVSVASPSASVSAYPASMNFLGRNSSTNQFQAFEQPLPRETTFKYLGVVFDNFTSWKTHADYDVCKNRRLQDILILMYKVKHNLVPKTMIDIFPISNSKYKLRNKDFSIPSIRYLGPYLWSKMNINLRQKTSLQAFKDAIRGRNLKGLMDGSFNCKVCQS